VELGAEDYLNKPINSVLLRARVNASLEKKRLRDEQRKLFRTFATKEVADELLRTGFSLGGKYVHASVMFADIRSFTTIGEQQDPAHTIELLNNYFALMFEAIIGHHGTVNQLQGDGLMAIFGAPIHKDGHREHAVRAALEMIELLKEFNIERAAQNKVQIKIGIGVASGTVIAGYTGTQHRATYTCVGDTVNLAARIEDHTKTVEQPILIDQYTREGLPEDIRVEALGAILFKGKQQPIHIFAVNT
jgi:class 3 adenylate cyclase